MLSGAGLLHAARVFALVEMVLDAEIFGLLRHLAAGIRVSEEDLAVGAIGEVGPAASQSSHVPRSNRRGRQSCRMCASVWSSARKLPPGPSRVPAPGSGSEPCWHRTR